MSPTLDVAGSFFPSWIFCAACGAVVCAVVRAVLGFLGLAGVIVMPILTYTAIGLASALAIWLVWFGA